MTEAADMDYQAVALKKISPHLLDKRTVAASLATLGMTTRYTWLKRHTVDGVQQYEGMVKIEAMHLPPREALIALTNWYFTHPWFLGEITVLLYPQCGIKGWTKPYVPLKAFHTPDHKSLHLGNKLRLPCASALQGVDPAVYRQDFFCDGDWELVEANYRELSVSVRNHVIK